MTGRRIGRRSLVKQYLAGLQPPSAVERARSTLRTTPPASAAAGWPQTNKTARRRSARRLIVGIIAGERRRTLTKSYGATLEARVRAIRHPRCSPQPRRPLSARSVQPALFPGLMPPGLRQRSRYMK